MCLELSLLGDDWGEAVGDPAFVATLAALAKYIAAEGVTREHFSPRDRRELVGAWTAVNIVCFPEDYPTSGPGYEALVEAGLIS